MKPKFNLEELKRENVFNVPENYFDKLPNRIMQRVTVSSESTESVTWVPASWKIALAGSGFAAVFATVFMLNFNDPQPDFSGQLAQINDTEIVNYLLASEQLERSDLVLFNASEQDLTHEFIMADDAAISEVLEEETIDETYL